MTATTSREPRPLAPEYVMVLGVVMGAVYYAMKNHYLSEPPKGVGFECAAEYSLSIMHSADLRVVDRALPFLNDTERATISDITRRGCSNPEWADEVAKYQLHPLHQLRVWAAAIGGA